MSQTQSIFSDALDAINNHYDGKPVTEKQLNALAQRFIECKYQSDADFLEAILRAEQAKLGVKTQ